MKRVFLLALLFLFIHSYADAQIQLLEKKTEAVVVGKVNLSGITRTQLSYVPGADTVYTWVYRNENLRSNHEYYAIKFSGKGNTVDQLYGMLKDFWSEANKEKPSKEVQKTFKLGETEVTVVNQRMFGRTQIFVQTAVATIALFEKGVDQLFGRTK